MLTSTYLPLVGGLEIVVHNLATALTNLGHRVYIVTPQPTNRKVRDNFGYKVVRFGFKGYGRLKLPSILAVATLAYVVKRYKIHVVHVHNVYKPGSWAFNYKKFNPRLPIVGTPHGDDVLITPEIQDGVRLEPELDKIVRRNLNAFNFVTAISPSLRHDLYNIVYGKNRIIDIPNGVWVKNYQKDVDKIQVREKFGIPPDALVVISIGRNHPCKGFENGIKALAMLKNERFKIAYVLLGRDMEPIIKKARQLNVPECLITPGQVDTETVSQLLQSSDIYLSTSIVESFGLTTIEAMSAGLPCVVTDIAGSRDLVSSDYGFLVTPGKPEQITDALKWLVKNPSARKDMGKKAQKVALKYDWPIIANRYVDVYKTAISTSY